MYTTFVYNHLLQLSLGRSSLHYPLVNRVGRNKSKDKDRPGLTYTMTSVLCLKVTLWVLLTG